MPELFLTIFFISILLIFLGTGIWVALSMVGVSAIRADTFRGGDSFRSECFGLHTECYFLVRLGSLCSRGGPMDARRFPSSQSLGRSYILRDLSISHSDRRHDNDRSGRFVSGQKLAGCCRRSGSVDFYGCHLSGF